ncbi:MAG: DUF2855 family protein [Pseudomonadota bacterium]
MRQFQIDKTNLSDAHLVEGAVPEAGAGEVVFKVERFGLSANNITYAVAGETLGYWQFFKPCGDASGNAGLMPVWGFARITESNVDGMDVGERVFGYFPPADYLTMEPVDIAATHFYDGSQHRAQLPKGYNIYRRVEAEPGYDPRSDDTRMLLYPLYLTAFVIADQLEEHDYYEADSVLVVSASSKTSIGLAYALQGSGKKTIGLTSAGNVEFVMGLGIYDAVVAYSDIEKDLPLAPSVIVDMAGNAELLGNLHALLGDRMRHTLSVGLTHWEADRRSSMVIKDRTEFFFAPSRVQKRIKDWGASEFGERSGRFVMKTAADSLSWLEMKELDGLDGLAKIYPDLLKGNMDPKDGFLVKMPE